MSTILHHDATDPGSPSRTRTGMPQGQRVLNPPRLPSSAKGPSLFQIPNTPDISGDGWKPLAGLDGKTTLFLNTPPGLFHIQAILFSLRGLPRPSPWDSHRLSRLPTKGADLGLVEKPHQPTKSPGSNERPRTRPHRLESEINLRLVVPTFSLHLVNLLSSHRLPIPSPEAGNLSHRSPAAWLQADGTLGNPS